MSPKMPFSPRIYWLICTLLFFFFSSCSFTKSLLRKSGTETRSQAILWNKYPKKLNPKFYSEGSTYYRFIERNAPTEGAKITDWELTFLILDRDFLTSLKESFPLVDSNLYKLVWRKRIGKYTLATNKKDFIASFNLLESGEASGEILPDLLTRMASAKLKPTNINETVSFYVEGSVAYLTSESIISDTQVTYEWKNEIPSSEVNPPTSLFLSSKTQDKPITFKSPHYDYFQFQFEVIETEPSKLFYKSIFSDQKYEIYFLPPLANDISTKPKEPVGYKRIGDYLLREETP
jgi:hypothetical protein